MFDFDESRSHRPNCSPNYILTKVCRTELFFCVKNTDPQSI